MIEKHTKQLLQHGYTTTVVLYPFREESTVAYSHIMGSETIVHCRVRTSCFIHRSKIVEEPPDEIWDYVPNNTYLFRKKRIVEAKEEELLFVDSYLTKLYELYQKGNQRNENEEKIKTLLEESFSKELSRVVMGEKEDYYNTLTREAVDDNHYIVVVPSDWTDRKMAVENILRPIFIDSGLIKRDGPPYRLIFVDTLSAIFYSFQTHWSDPAKKLWLKYGTIKKNKHYALFDVDFESESNVASIACYFFQTGNTNSMVNGVEVFQPHNVSSSRSGKINLVSAYTIENNLLGLLYNKKILPLPLSRPPELLMRTSIEEEAYDRNIDRLLKIMIELTYAYYVNSESDNNGLENKDGKSNTSQMPLQCPFRNLDFGDYIELTKPQSKALQEINMEELYNILFCENETRIKKYAKVCLKEYGTTLQGAVLVKKYSDEKDNYSIDNPYTSAESERSDDEYKKHVNHYSDNKITLVPSEYNTSINTNDYYIELVSRIICSCTEQYYSSTATDILEKDLKLFMYDQRTLVDDLLLKIQDDVQNTLNFLPPSIIWYPESKYTSILESTEKTNPKYIIKIDLSLQSCRYLFAQADNKDQKGDGAKIDYGSKTKALDVPSLNRFIRVESHTSASLHISQKMFDYLLKFAHFRATLNYFAKYNGKVLRGVSNLDGYEEVCDKEDTNHSELPSPFDFSSSENETLLPTIEKLFRNHDNASKENPILTVHRPSYIMAFIVTYLIYLKFKIDASFKQYYIDASNEVSYAVSVEELLLDKCLMGSKSIMKELLIASGITNESIIRKQLRVITQGECSFPMMQEKAKLDLPLKAYYVHAQLYESSIQLALNQVVKKELHPMTIVIKSYIIPMKHMHELLCDSLWSKIQSNCHKSVCERHRVDRNENLEEEREYSMADRLEFEEYFMQYVKNLPSLKKATDFEGLKMPKGGSSCSCSVYLTHTDIVELAIKPVLKTIVSSILSTLTNDQIFGEYYISALFVTFDSILNSVFHNSYKKFLKLILENTFKTRSEVRGLGIPYFVFIDSDNIDMIETRNRTFTNLFSEGSLSQVSSATYMLRLTLQNENRTLRDVKVYTKDPKTLRLSQVSINDGDRILITILERGDQLSFKEEGIKKKIYICFSEEEEEEEDQLILDAKLLRFDSKLSKDDKLNPNKKDFVFAFCKWSNFYDPAERNPKVGKIMPLYINIRSLGYRSLIEMSFEYGYRFYDEDTFTPELFKMGEQLTLKSTHSMYLK